MIAYAAERPRDRKVFPENLKGLLVAAHPYESHISRNVHLSWTGSLAGCRRQRTAFARRAGMRFQMAAKEFLLFIEKRKHGLTDRAAPTFRLCKELIR